MMLLSHIHRHFLQGDKKITVLQDVCLHLKKGEIVGLLGASGTGKSTLLHIMGLLDQPSSGTLHLQGKNVTHATDTERTRLRRDSIGFVYQFHYLLPELSVLENVILPQKIKGVREKLAKQKAISLLDKLGLAHRLEHYPSQISGGEQQRVALARAMSNEPGLLLADEPTGNLDPQTTQTVFKEMLTIIRDSEITALIATHDRTLAQMMDRIISLEDGQICDVQKN